MKAISGAIIALAGAVLFAAGSQGTRDADTITMLVGAVVGIGGLVAWAREYMSSRSD